MSYTDLTLRPRLAILTLRPRIATGTGSRFDWCVDSVNGNDANSGKTTGLPLKTIAALLAKTIITGQRIGLAKGSVWREQLIIPNDSIQISGYGAGDNPILDCSDIAPNASFVKTGGMTNVFEITLSPDLAISGTFNSIWETGVRLTRATSIVNCDANAGSYYPSSETIAPITMYIHASDSSSVITNGKLYEYSRRLCSVESYAYTNIIVDGITGKRNLSESGSFRMGDLTTLLNCTAQDGNKHNFYYGDGSILTNCVATNAYYAAGSHTYYVCNTNVGLGLGCLFTNCAAQSTALDTLGSGFYWHRNVSGSLGAHTYINCAAINLNAGWDEGVHLTNLIITNPTISDCTYGISVGNSQIYSIAGGTASITTRFVTCGNTPATVALNGITSTITGASGAYIYSSQADFALTIQNCTTTIPGGGGVLLIYLAAGANSTVISDHNHFILPGGNAYVYYLGAGTMTIVSDYNQFSVGNSWFHSAAGTDYATVDLWQTGTGQDSHSTIG